MRKIFLGTTILVGAIIGLVSGIVYAAPEYNLTNSYVIIPLPQEEATRTAVGY